MKQPVEKVIYQRDLHFLCYQNVRSSRLKKDA